MNTWKTLPPDIYDELSSLDILETVNTERRYRYNYRVYPTQEQLNYIYRATGCVRQMHNLFVEKLYKYLESINFINGFIPGQYKSWIPKESEIKSRFPYMKDIDSLAFSNERLNFMAAVKRYNDQFAEKCQYRKSAMKKHKNTGYELTFRDLKGIPRFKAKFYSLRKYTTNNQNGTVHLEYPATTTIPEVKSYQSHKFVGLRLPRMQGILKMRYHRQIPAKVTVKAATISKECDNRFVASILVVQSLSFVRVKTDEESFQKLRDFLLKHQDRLCLGLDYAQQEGCVPSSDDEIDKILSAFTKVYRRTEKKIAALQHYLSRKKKPDHKNGIEASKSYISLQTRIAKLQARVARTRKDALDKLSSAWAKTYFLISVEDIDLRAMSQTLKLAKNLLDNSFGMFREMLKYKLEHTGRFFVKINKWYPSSQLCHYCGHQNRVVKNLSIREYCCEGCGQHILRDQNAALNIRTEGIIELQPLVEKATKSFFERIREGRHKKTAPVI